MKSVAYTLPMMTVRLRHFTMPSEESGREFASDPEYFLPLAWNLKPNYVRNARNGRSVNRV
jgi:hypothetical protein